MRTVGVEEELLLVDPETGAPVAVAGSVLAGAEGLEAELQQQQIEIGTDHSIADRARPTAAALAVEAADERPGAPVPDRRHRHLAAARRARADPSTRATRRWWSASG